MGGGGGWWAMGGGELMVVVVAVGYVHVGGLILKFYYGSFE